MDKIPIISYSCKNYPIFPLSVESSKNQYLGESNIKNENAFINNKISTIVPRIHIQRLIRNNCSRPRPRRNAPTHKTPLRDNFIETRAHG